MSSMREQDALDAAGRGARPPDSRATRWRNGGPIVKSKVTALFLLLGLGLALLACGGGDSSPSASDAAKATATPSGGRNLTPEQLGAEIGDLYVRALSEVTDLLKATPEASGVRDRVQQLRESYITRLVALGRAREAMNAAQRATVDSIILQKISAIGSQSWYATYGQVQQYYMKDADFSKLVVSFNIIGQYANFDLLKKQEPAEAKRLGIE